LSHGGPEPKGLDDILHLAASGRTSIPVDKEVEKGLYRAAGFRVCGERAVRVDILERLADLIRPAIQYRPGVTPGEPPAGTADGEGFVVTPAMTSLCGCAGEDFASILKSLGYIADKRPGPAITVALVAVAATVPAEATAGEAAPETSAAETAPEAATADAPPPADMTDAATPAETPAVVATEATETTTETTTEAAADAASAEPVLIEIWRQGRRQQGGGRPQQHRRPDQRSKGQRPAEAGAEGQSAENRPRRDRPHWKKPDGEGQDQRGPRPPRPDRDKLHGGKPGGRPQGGKPEFRQERPVREKQPDPNSPFAKLLALKAELEGKK
jgi:ATP-dependent RNA helicase SUPV3L1/SUV3